MQEKTILVPEIIEIINFDNLLRNLCPVCETWHSNKNEKCIFCQKHNFKKNNTLVLSFKPIITDKKNNNLIITKFSLIANKFKNIFFNMQNLNFYFYLPKMYDEKYEQYFDLFLDEIYKMFSWQKLKLFNFKEKYMSAFYVFANKRKRPFDKRILMPMFNCKTQRRKIINSNIETFF